MLTPGELDADIVRNKVQEGVFSLDAQPWMQHILMEQWEQLGDSFTAFLKENGLSTHMWMIATVK